MSKEIKNLSMPISKMEFSETINPSLSKCSIYVMHTGENLNGSSFDDSSVLYAKETLKNIPILASIKRDEDHNAVDFEGHEMETRLIERSNGDYDWKVVYIEKPIGVIPESNNYRIETLENGEKWVVVDGYIWKEYGNGAYDLLKNSDKKVSMEISVDEGYFDDGFMYHIKKYNYLGVTVLGENCPPAMGSNAIISLFNADNSAKEEYDRLLNEVENLEGGNTMEENKEFETEIEETTEEFAKKKRKCSLCEQEFEVAEDFSDEEEFTCDACKESEEYAKKKKKCEADEEETKEDFEAKYNEVVVELEDLKVKYTDLQTELATSKEEYTTLETEAKELREYKSNIEFEAHKVAVDEELAKYSELESVDGYADLIKCKYEVDINELIKDIKIFAFDNGVVLGKKAKKNFSKEVTNKIPVVNQTKEIPNAGAWDILDKYIKR